MQSCENVFLFPKDMQKIFLCNELQTSKACDTWDISKFYCFRFLHVCV